MSFRQYGPFILGTVASIAAGAGLCAAYFHLQKELREIRSILEELKHEVTEICDSRFSKRKAGKVSRYNYITASSGDDEDDEFEDAIGGGDIGTLSRHDSLERNVQFATPLVVNYDEGDNEFFKEIDELLAGPKAQIKQAYCQLQEKQREMSVKAEFQWRLAKAAYNYATTEGENGNADRKKELVFESKEAACCALNLNPWSSDAHKWYAIALGSTGDYEPMAEKIKNAYKIRDHIQKAIQLNPTDPTPHHMLGRWCYSVYMLSWFERKAAATFFGEPPVATVDEALGHFMEAEKHRPDSWKENMLYVAKCLIEKKDYTGAGEWLQRALNTNDVSSSEGVEEEIKVLLSKYGL